MNVVGFWQKQVDQWNEDSKCGLCWEYSAPLFVSALNKTQTKKDCCVYVFLTNYSIESRNEYNQRTGLILRRSSDHSFNLYFLMKGDLGTNHYNEINGYPIADSRWETIYKPILDCIDFENLQLNFCEFMGIDPFLLTWRMDMVQAYQDFNYFGWRATVKFRKNF